MRQSEVSRATMGRIPTYLKYLKGVSHTGENISATVLAKQLGLGEVQVRKDLSSVSGAGRPKTGYNIKELIGALEGFLCTDDNNDIVLVGAGKLGSALLDYNGFEDYGLKISAAFDAKCETPSVSKHGKPILPMSELESFCKENNIGIGVITVPAEFAQEVCDKLVSCGVRAVWCFAPCVLNVPKDVTVQYENMALSLAYLNKKVGFHQNDF